MTSTATVSTEWPQAVHHPDGIRTKNVHSQKDFDDALKGGWLERPPTADELPPPPPPPMRAEEVVALFPAVQTRMEELGNIDLIVDGIADQVQVQAKIIASMETKIFGLEESLKNSAAAFEQIEKRLSRIEKKKESANAGTETAGS